MSGENTSTQDRHIWSVEGWRSFWARPSISVAMERVPSVTAHDIVGYWPRATRPVVGREAYTKRIVNLLMFIPDFRAELAEHAANGEFTFIRWAASGTGPDGPFSAIGVDRLRLRDGLVAENMIISDHPIFEALTDYSDEQMRL